MVIIVRIIDPIIKCYVTSITTDKSGKYPWLLVVTVLQLYWHLMLVISLFQSLYAEREGLSSTLDESADRIVMLEKEARERDCLVNNIIVLN